MIILTKDQANQVRMLTAAGHALAPKPISISATAAIAGKFALPESCLTDPYHSRHYALLASFPKVPDNTVKLGDWETNATIVTPCTYNLTWPVGQLVVVP